MASLAQRARLGCAGNSGRGREWPWRHAGEARRIFAAGVAAADPGAAVARALADAGGGWRQVIAVGKAARGMASAALRVLGPVPALVVTNYENAAPLEGAEVLAAGHPVPDAAARRRRGRSRRGSPVPRRGIGC
jgi:glycerate 2-kinase